MLFISGCLSLHACSPSWVYRLLAAAGPLLALALLYGGAARSLPGQSETIKQLMSRVHSDFFASPKSLPVSAFQ
jgi:hypothetical protein